MDNSVKIVGDAHRQIDWVDELYDVVEIMRKRVRQYELRLKRVEGILRREGITDDDSDFEVPEIDE